jgi:hypothetical protein
MMISICKSTSQEVTDAQNDKLKRNATQFFLKAN